MIKLKKILVLTISTLIILSNTAFAVDPASYTRTLLPETNKEIIKSNADCTLIITNFESIYFDDSKFPEPTPPQATTTTPATPTAPTTPTETANPQETQDANIQENNTTTSELGSIKRFSDTLRLLNQTLKQYEAIAGIRLNDNEIKQNDILGCAIVTGRISFMYLSIFFSYALNMIAILAGSISMIFIIIGGYKYVVGSLTQNTDDAKKTITNAIVGLLLSTGAWIIVNIVLAIVSS